MMTAGKEVEHYVQRLAQMARACGIHLVMATQTECRYYNRKYKANFPSRISFKLLVNMTAELCSEKLEQNNFLEWGYAHVKKWWKYI